MLIANGYALLDMNDVAIGGGHAIWLVISRLSDSPCWHDHYDVPSGVEPLLAPDPAQTSHGYPHLASYWKEM